MQRADWSGAYISSDGCYCVQLMDSTGPVHPQYQNHKSKGK